MLRKILMAPEDSGGGGATPPPAAADTAAATPDPTPPEGGLKLGDGTVWRNAKELKDALQKTREQEKVLSRLAPILEQFEKLGGQPVTQPQAPAPAVDTTKVDARFSFREALLDHEVPRDKREIVERLWKSEQPTNLDEWMPKTLESLGVKKPGQAPTPIPTAPPIAPSNTGAPVRESVTETLSENPWEWPLHVAQKMGIQKFHEAVQAHKRARGGGHPYAEFHEQRRRSANGSPVAALATQLAEELKKGK